MGVPLLKVHEGPKSALHAINVRPGVGPLVTQLIRGG